MFVKSGLCSLNPKPWPTTLDRIRLCANMARMAPISEPEDRFLTIWSQCRDRRDAYRSAFPDLPHSRKPMMAHVRALMARPEVNARWRELEDARAASLGLTRDRAIRMLLDVWDVDVNELVSLHRGCCRHCHGLEHRYQWREIEYMNELDEVTAYNAARNDREAHRAPPDPQGGFGYDPTLDPAPECPMCSGEGDERVVMSDTTQLTEDGRKIYAGVKLGRHGPEMLIVDRVRCLELACKLAGLLASPGEISITGLAAITRVADLQSMDPESAARAYQDMIGATRLT